MYTRPSYKEPLAFYIDLVILLAGGIFFLLVNLLTLCRIKVYVKADVESRKYARERAKLYEEAETFLNECVRKEKKV